MIREMCPFCGNIVSLVYADPKTKKQLVIGPHDVMVLNNTKLQKCDGTGQKPLKLATS